MDELSLFSALRATAVVATIVSRGVAPPTLPFAVVASGREGSVGHFFLYYISLSYRCG